MVFFAHSLTFSYDAGKTLRQILPTAVEGRPGAQRFRWWQGEPTTQCPRSGPGAASLILDSLIFVSEGGQAVGDGPITAERSQP
jgi:hypothetical protein